MANHMAGSRVPRHGEADSPAGAANPYRSTSLQKSSQLAKDIVEAGRSGTIPHHKYPTIYRPNTVKMVKVSKLKVALNAEQKREFGKEFQKKAMKKAEKKNKQKKPLEEEVEEDEDMEMGEGGSSEDEDEEGLAELMEMEGAELESDDERQVGFTLIRAARNMRTGTGLTTE